MPFPIAGGGFSGKFGGFRLKGEGADRGIAGKQTDELLPEGTRAVLSSAPANALLGGGTMAAVYRDEVTLP
jgi:hypothetical protein